MNYKKVKPESDQVRKPGKRHDILIKNELYTYDEFTKLNVTPEFAAKHFDTVIINKNKTYFSFGARFAS